jgi:hypothetical protein
MPLEKIETIRDDGLIEGADPTIAALTGKVGRALRGYDADRPRGRLHPGRLGVRLHALGTGQARSDSTRSVSAQAQARGRGPGGVQASFDFRGAKNTAAGRTLTVILTNDLEGTVYE